MGDVTVHDRLVEKADTSIHGVYLFMGEGQTVYLSEDELMTMLSSISREKVKWAREGWAAARGRTEELDSLKEVIAPA